MKSQMMKCLIVVVFVAILVLPLRSALCQKAAEIRDGVYSVQLEGGGATVVRNDTGETVVLEKRLA